MRFDSDNALHWECITYEEKVRSADETITRLVIRPDVHFLSWTEADGLVVTQGGGFHRPDRPCRFTDRR